MNFIKNIAFFVFVVFKILKKIVFFPFIILKKVLFFLLKPIFRKPFLKFYFYKFYYTGGSFTECHRLVLQIIDTKKLLKKYDSFVWLIMNYKVRTGGNTEVQREALKRIFE